MAITILPGRETIYKPAKKSGIATFAEALGEGVLNVTQGMNLGREKKLKKQAREEENKYFKENFNIKLPEDEKARSEVIASTYKEKIKQHERRETYKQLMGIDNPPEKDNLQSQERPPTFGGFAEKLAAPIVNASQEGNKANALRTGQNPSQEDVVNDTGEIEVGNVGIKTAKPYSEKQIMAMEASGLHNEAMQARAANKQIFADERHRELSDLKERSLEDKKFEADRAYNTQFSKESEKEVEGIRASLSKKEASLNYARDAIESGEVDYFSKNKLADIFGNDLFRTAKGVQLTTAGKENLLANMTRVTGRAQNMWFEQRLNSMFPKIGQSKEANLTVQEMLEGEIAMDKAYVSEFDKIAKRDMQDYGYVKKDIASRAHQAIKPVEKEIMQRTTYRMKEIEEVEKGVKKLKERVGKNVVKGTPLTLAMAKLYHEKFGENGLSVAKKNGYFVPTVEEYTSMRLQPQEYREEL